jgi:hypothetical protein
MVETKIDVEELYLCRDVFAQIVTIQLLILDKGMIVYVFELSLEFFRWG